MSRYREALVLVSFDLVKAGSYLRVDTSSPWVQGVLASGYIKLIDDVGEVAWEVPDDSVDSDGPGAVSDNGVDAGVAGPETEPVNGSGVHQPADNGVDGAAADDPAGTQDG